jgi:hypothetical protein
MIRELNSIVEDGATSAKEDFAIKKATKNKKKKRYRLTQREFIQTTPVKSKKF